MRLALLGLGLIGGSIARAVHGRAGWSVSAWTPSGSGPEAAARAGVVRPAESAGAAIDGADLVVLAAPPLACLRLIDELAGPLRQALGPDAVVTDVASTKAALVARARDRGLRFVGGHPMAGREASGYDAAAADLFDGRPWVIVGDGADDAAAERVRSLARACRARPVELSAAAHDAAVAAISHLPLVVSAALVEAVAGTPDHATEDWPLAAGLAASGWRDMTRLARGDVAMGAGIAATNAGPLAARVRALRDVLDGWLVELEAERDAGGPPAVGGGERLAARLRDARAVLEASER